jgi:PAS domain S-box-containing protein
MSTDLLIDKYRLAFNISPVPLLLVSDNGEIILANSGLLDLFEYSAEALIGKNVEILVPESVRSHHHELRNAYHRVPTKRSMGDGRDLYGVTQSGHTIPLELGIEPVSDNDTTMALIAAIDIRQRKIHEERMHQAMDAAASAMVMVDHQGIIVFVNRTASLLFGYDERDMMGQPVEMLIPETFRRAHPVYTSGYMSDSSKRAMGLGRDLFARRKDGTQFPVEISLTPVESSDGKMVMSTIIDLSERVAAAAALARKNNELETLNVELSHFANSASHDLKAPLSSIAGLLQLCIEDLQDGDTEEVHKNMMKVIDISRRSAEKVEGILRIARAGRDSIPKEKVSLEKLIQEIWMDLTGANISSELRLDVSKAKTLVTELATMRVVFENLLSNAIRYADMEKDSHVIHVKSKYVDKDITITVTDNGIGIPKDSVGKVFMMFKRLDDRSGDGLGLSLVKKQIDRLDGTIVLASVEGEGTTLTVTLPANGL